MNSLLRALTVLLLLAAAVVLVALGTQNPGHVSLTYGTYQIEVSLAVAAAALALLLGLMFYLGQLINWLGRLPGKIQDLATGRHKQSTLQALAEGYAAAQLGLAREASRAANRANPSPAEAPLANLLAIRLGTTPATQLSRWQADALLGAPASLELAHRAALNADWPAVKTATAKGLERSPNSPRLLFLHLKSLLNLNENAAAADLFPALRPHLTSGTAKKLEILLGGSLNPDVSSAGLKNPWYAAFQQWLTNSAEQLPEA
jgi:uncharacterized protein HemY